MQSPTRAEPARPTSSPAADPTARSIDFTLAFPARIGAAIQARAGARGMTPEAWIREWVTVGLAEESIGFDVSQPAEPSPPARSEKLDLGELNLSVLKDVNTVLEVSRMLGVHQKTIYRAIERGHMGCRKIEGNIQVLREHVEEFLRANTHEARKEGEGKTT